MEFVVCIILFLLRCHTESFRLYPDCCDGSDEVNEYGETPCPNTCLNDTANPLFYIDSFQHLHGIIEPFRNYSIWKSLYEKKYVIRKTAEYTLAINDVQFNATQLHSLFSMSFFVCFPLFRTG